MSEPAIAIEDLHKGYRAGGLKREVTQVLRGVDLTIGRGQAWALVGPNGAGKTTMLHCLMGLLRPDRGSIAVAGGPPAAATTRARMGFQSEIFFSYEHLPAGACMGYYGRLSGIAPATLPTRVAGILARMGLASARQRVGTFSKGMVARLGLGQSLLHSPEVIVWDEPTSGLDPEGRRLVHDLVAELRAQGRTILLSSHLLPDVERMCDHLAVMARGRIVLAGPIAELRAARGGASLEDIYLGAMREGGDAL